MSMAFSDPANRELRMVSLTGRWAFSPRLECRSRAAVVEQADEARPDAVGEAVSDGGGLRRGFGQAAGGGLEERLPLFEGGLQLELPYAEALIGMLEQDALLDGEQLADPRKGLIAEAGFRQIVEIASPMRHTKLKEDGSGGPRGVGEDVVCGVAIDLGEAGEVPQHGFRDGLSAPRAGPEERRGRRRPGEGAVVAQRGPEVAGPGLSEARFEELDRCLVEEQPVGGEDMRLDGVMERLQDLEAPGDPAVEGGIADEDAVAGKPLRQAVGGEVVLEL